LYGKVFKVKKVWEYIPTIVCKCSLKQFFNFDFMKDNVENVHSFSTDLSTCSIAIFANMRISRNECLRMRNASNVL
jgi:hypothetical protein